MLQSLRLHMSGDGHEYHTAKPTSLEKRHMNTDLTREQVLQYEKFGFVKIEGFLDSDELIHWQETIDDAVNTRHERIPGFNDGGGIGDEFYDNVFKQRVNLWKTNSSVKNLVLDQQIGRMAATLEGLDVVRIWHDQALYKGPWANPTSWHIDNPYWSFTTRNATTIWIALDDTTIQNGALYFLPGAQKEATFDNVPIGENVGSLFAVYEDWGRRSPTCVEMKAGDASFHNGLAPHAAGPNMTPEFRRAFAIIFMPDGATFNGQKNILPDPYFKRLSIGDPLDNDDLNPVIYQKTGAT